jgi:hypothetical protein
LAGCFAYTTRQNEIEAPGDPGEYSDIKKTRNARPSTRDLVQENLWYLDTGVSSPTFFWGRWVRRKELHFVAVGAPGAGGGSIGGSSDAGVVVENLLVAFDDDGRPLQWNVVDDDDVLKKMVPILRRSKIDDQLLPPVPFPCQFQWDQRKSLKSGSSRHFKTISLRFFTASDRRKPTCEVNGAGQGRARDRGAPDFDRPGKRVEIAAVGRRCASVTKGALQPTDLVGDERSCPAAALRLTGRIQASR